MILDFHAHVHLWGAPDEADRLVSEARRYGIAKVGVSAIGTYIPSRRELRTLNEKTFTAAQRWPDVILPFVYVNPMHGPDAVAMIEEAHARGAVAVKLWVAVRANQRCMWPLAERCIELGLPVLQHAWHKYNGALPYESDPLDVAELGRTFPELTIVMAHLGGSWEWGVKAIRDVPNISSDTSGTRIEAGQIEYAVAQLGAERVVYGSDALPCDYLLTLAKIEAAAIAEEDKQAILGRNAARILRLAG